MGWVNDFIKPTGYVAGTDHYTLADISFLCTVSTLEELKYFDLSAYPETVAWYEKLKGEVPNYEKVGGEGARGFAKWWFTVRGKPE